MRRHAALFLFILVFAIGVMLAPRAGVAWDEPDNIFASGTYITFFTKGFDFNVFRTTWDQPSYFRDTIYTQDPTMSHYPPFPYYVGDVMVLVARHFHYGVTASEIITLFHVAAALFLAILVATVYRFGRLVGLSPGVSIAASVITYLYPTVFGHGLTDLKDTAQVTLFTLSLYYLVRGNKGDLIKGALIWGLGLATKFNLIYVPIIWGLYGVRGKKGMIQWVSVVAIGVTVAILVWPYLWIDPVHKIVEVVRYFTTVGKGYFVFWDGSLYRVGLAQSLWWYPWKNLLYMTPILVVGLGILGGLRAWTGKKALLLLWFLIPLFRSFLPHAAFYDAIRHFMEVIPPGALLAGIGISALGGVWGTILGAAAIVQLVLINATYFPYSTGYYNFLASKPNQNFERDIEGLSVKEGMEWVQAHYPQATFAVPVAEHLGWEYVRPQDTFVLLPQEADTVVLANKQSHVQTKKPDEINLTGFSLVHTITRGTNIFGWVYRRVNGETQAHSSL